MFDPRTFFPQQLLAARRPTRRAHGDLLDLSRNELVHPQLDAIITTFYSAAITSWVTRYPTWPVVLASIARQFELPVEWIWISAGSDQAIRTVIRLAATAGHRLILQWPNHATYQTAASGEGIPLEKVAFVRSSADEEVAALCAAAHGPGSAVVVVTNPHGLTGRLLAPDAMAALATVCERRGHLLVIDEAYIWFAASDHLTLLETFPNLLLLRSFSKGLGMAGLRLAALIARPETLDYIARTGCITEVSHPALAFVEHCINHWSVLTHIWQDIARFRDESARTLEILDTGWSCPASSANFQLVDTGTAESAVWVTSALERRGILVRSLRAEPFLTSCFRYSVCGDNSTPRLLETLSELARAKCLEDAKRNAGRRMR